MPKDRLGYQVSKDESPVKFPFKRFSRWLSIWEMGLADSLRRERKEEGLGVLLIEIGLSIFGISVVLAPIFLATNPKLPFYVMLFGLMLCLVEALVDSFS